MNSPEHIAVSKFLSLVLRHKPETIGVRLDAHGWLDIDVLLRQAAAHGRTLDRQLIERVVRSSDKQRFAISEDGQCIRANQGHSVEVDLELTPQQPPEELYHGTVARFITSIRATGLRPGQRQHVHLSPDRETAERVGSRRGQAVILVVRAGELARTGGQFYRSANGVWLTEHVPSQFIAFPDGP